MLRPGDSAPDLQLDCASKGRASTLRLSESRSDYPLDFSSICPSGITGFNKALKSFADARCGVLGTSNEDFDSHLKWASPLGAVAG